MEEQQKTQSNKKCHSCGSYLCYYTSGYMRFNREKVGYCNRHEKITRNMDTCENWRNNQFRRRRLNQISIKALNETIAQLVEVTGIIIEDIENKHIQYLLRERLEEKLNAIEENLAKKEDTE